VSHGCPIGSQDGAARHIEPREGAAGRIFGTPNTTYWGVGGQSGRNHGAGTAETRGRPQHLVVGCFDDQPIHALEPTFHTLEPTHGPLSRETTIGGVLI